MLILRLQIHNTSDLHSITRVPVAEKRNFTKTTSLLSSGMDILIGRRRSWSPIPIKMGVRAVQGPVPT